MARSYGVTVRQYQGNIGQVPVRCSTTVGERIIDFLKDRHPTKPVENVSLETGISMATIAKWFERASVPGGLAMIELTAAYGPEFLCAVMTTPPAWLDEARREAEHARIAAQIEALKAQQARLKP